MKLTRALALIFPLLLVGLFFAAPDQTQAGYYQTVEGTYTRTITCSMPLSYRQNVSLDDPYLNLILSGNKGMDKSYYVTDSTFNPAAGDYFYQRMRNTNSMTYRGPAPAGDPCFGGEFQNLRVVYTISQGYDFSYWDPTNPFSGSQWMTNSVTIDIGYFWEVPTYVSYSYQVYIPTPPRVDLEVSPQRARTGEQAALSWEVVRGVNTTDTVSAQSWPLGSAPGPTQYTGSATLTLPQPGSFTFTLRAANEDGAAAASRTLTVTGEPITPAEIDLSPKTFSFSAVSGGSAPASQTLTVKNKGKTTLNYTARTSQTWCRLNGRNNASQVTGSLEKNKDTTLSVSVDAPSNAGAFNCTLTVSDPAAANSPQSAAVTYAVSQGITIPAKPSNTQVYNSGGGGGNPACSRILITWTDNSDNERGFRVYRSKPGRQGSANLDDYTRIQDTAASNVTSYTDPTAPADKFYSYATTAYNQAGESAPDFSAQVYNTPCAPNLSSSSKVIQAVNAVNYTGQTIKNGDTLRFQITIRNSGTSPATNVSVADTLSTNLIYQNQARLKKGSAPPQSITGSQNGQVITFPGLGDKPPDSQDNITWLLTFDARVQTLTSQAVEFAQNTAEISFQGGSPVSKATGLFPVRTSAVRIPDIKEIAP